MVSTSMASTINSEFLIQFWGVRGSVPSPGSDTVRYGGNTSCVEMRIGGRRLIFDGGTGLRMLGKTLKPEMPINAHMFFTHYHWDHIQGVPFFTPIFTEGNTLHIHGAVPTPGISMEEHFQGRVLHLNSPVPVAQMRADIQFHDLVCGETFQVEDITIETAPLNHPNGAMGYRVTWQGHSVFYCTDTEHFVDRPDENVMRLAQDADMLIYDAMYTDEEYHNPKSPKVGWGHSTWQEALKVGEVAGVKRVAIFHHEPNHTDDFLDQVALQVADIAPKSFMAREGLVVSVN